MFVATPAGPYTASVSTVTAASLNYARLALADAVDGVGGGTYALGSALAFSAGGGSFAINAPFAASDVTSLALYGTEEVKSTGVIQLDSSATLNAANGSIVELSGATYVADGGGGGTNGHLYIGFLLAGAGAVVVYTGSNITMQSGSTLDAQSSSIVKLDGATTVHSGGTFTANSGTTTSFLSGATLTTAQPASNADPGQNNITVTGVPKSWGKVTITAGPAGAVNDGYNVSNTVTFPSFLGGNSVKITFARAMANANYSVSVIGQGKTISGPSSQLCVGFLVAQTTTDFTVVFDDITSASILLPDFFTFQVCGRE